MSRWGVPASGFIAKIGIAPLVPRVLKCVLYDDVRMGAIASQITSFTIVYSIVYSDADQRKHQSSAPLAFVRGIHRGPVISPHKWPVTRKMFPFDDVIMSFWLVTAFLLPFWLQVYDNILNITNTLI